MIYRFFICMILCLGVSCTTKFHYVTNKRVDEDFSNKQAFNLADDYELFVRQVVKVYDSVNRTFVPQNGTVATGAELIEVEYMLLSKDRKRAIVINNIANRNKNFYNSPDKLLDLGKINDSTTTVDIWYFSQFRFGKMDRPNRIIFSQVMNESKDHYWVLDEKDNVVRVHSVSVADNLGEDLRLVDQALAVPMLFVKSNRFHLVFKKNRGKGGKDEIDTYELANQRLFVGQYDKGWCTIFRFDTTIHYDHSNVVFFDKRMYAAPR